jgi:hypothetical protein
MITRCFLAAGLIAVTVTSPSPGDSTPSLKGYLSPDLNRAFQGIIQPGSVPPSDPQEDSQQAQFRTYILQKQLEKQQTYQTLLTRAYQADEVTLRAALRSKSGAERFAASYIVGERLLPWQDELIDQLTDPSDIVRQAARRSLVMLSFFTLRGERATPGADNPAGEKGTEKPSVVDFGPKAHSDKPAREEAAKKWRTWWTEHGGLEKSRQTELRSVRTESDQEHEIAHLSAELAYADPAQQAERLARYRNEKGVVYTEAIADALPQLNGDVLRTARQSLAERLSRMTAATLHDRLSDPRPELRRAAALAWAMKDDRAAVPELIPLLADADDFVVRGVKAALKSLTGQDFGPGRNASPAECTAAVAAWKSWWQKQQ